MYTKLKHRNHERVTPVRPFRELGKAVCLVQSITIPAPVNVIFLCGILAFALDVLDFLRNQATNFLLTVCQFFTPFLIPAAPASAPGAATPSGFRRPRRWHWLPRHPTPQPVRRAAAGRAFPLGRSLRPPAGGTRSLTGSRRCPRSMTPGTAAAPAPGCWPRLLRPAADGGALRKQRRVGLRSGKAADESRTGKSALCRAVSAHNMASVIRNCKQLTCSHAWLHSYNSCYAHNRPCMGRWAASATSTGGAGGRHLRPPAERPSAAARCCRCPGRAGGRGGQHLRPQPAHGAGRAGPSAKQGGPPSRAPAPAHPTQRRRGLGRVGLRRPGPASRRSPARAFKPA